MLQAITTWPGEAFLALWKAMTQTHTPLPADNILLQNNKIYDTFSSNSLFLPHF